MKKENYGRVDEIMKRIWKLQRDIETLDHVRNRGEDRSRLALISDGFPHINLLDRERNFDKVRELIDYSLRDKRKEIIELEDELETL